jgi:hypothetical protein
MSGLEGMNPYQGRLLQRLNCAITKATTSRPELIRIPIVDRRDGKQYQVTPLRTSQVPRQPRVLTVEQAKQLVNAALTQDVPQPPSVLSEVVKIQQARGQR